MTFDLRGGFGVTDQVGNADVFYAVMQCCGCREGVLCELRRGASTPFETLRNSNQHLVKAEFSLRAYWPRPAQVDAPDRCPGNFARFYKQAGMALARGDWDAAGIMARNALDAATFDIDSGLDRVMKLMKRIDKLAADHKITPQLQEWAHAIRVDGNDAVHDPDEFAEDEAKQICEFTRTFLEYVFTMPGKLLA
jgi:Domain of unknown function (DUF4145)